MIFTKSFLQLFLSTNYQLYGSHLIIKLTKTNSFQRNLKFLLSANYKKTNKKIRLTLNILLQPKLDLHLKAVVVEWLQCESGGECKIIALSSIFQSH